MPSLTSATTLAAALVKGATTLNLTSGTGVAVGSYLWIDSEVIRVKNVTSPYSTTFPFVERGLDGTRDENHISGAVVGLVTAGSPFGSNVVPPPGFGPDVVYTPRFQASNSFGKYRDYAYGTLRALTAGNDTAIVVTTTYIIDVLLRRSRVLNGIGVLLGSVSTNGHGIAILYDKDGNVLATSAVAGTTTGTAATEQAFPFTAPYLALGPAQYFIGYQGDSTSDKIRTVASATNTDELATSVTGGTFGTIPNIVPPTTFTAAVGPLAYLY